MIEKQQKAFFSVELMSWNENSNHRVMPWKGIRDPYKIWLSEIILQQTRVEQGMAYYERFIANFPSANSLSAGMSSDFEIAIAHGATHLRVGSEILGSRTYHP